MTLTNKVEEYISKPTITIKTEMIDGIFVDFPVCEKAKIFAELAGTDTISTQLRLKIESLGFEIFTSSLYWYSQV